MAHWVFTLNNSLDANACFDLTVELTSALPGSSVQLTATTILTNPNLLTSNDAVIKVISLTGGC